MKKIILFFKNHPILKHLIFIGLVVVVLIWIVLHSLDIYTRHGESVMVPDVKRMQVEDAKALFTRHGLRSEVIDSVYVDNIPRGAVVEQIPQENSPVKENRIVFLTINSNLPRKVTVPDVRDMSYRQAVAILEGIGLSQPEIEYVASEYKDLVLDVVYNGVSVERGLKLPVSSRLKLFVGNGTAEIIEDSVIINEDSVGEEWME
ncbi:PASTA domain-containing protein [uncultured Coprobacter sp.]|uniref:PASTA domain-containing protein n=1 Tax=uncultured Coprobacter sp. TaxID=1720550 RepID=UPI00260689DA|nr:PASTA domain-containing protein [uncultured Coprobacter sp.]